MGNIAPWPGGPKTGRAVGGVVATLLGSGLPETGSVAPAASFSTPMTGVAGRGRNQPTVRASLGKIRLATRCRSTRETASIFSSMRFRTWKLAMDSKVPS